MKLYRSIFLGVSIFLGGCATHKEVIPLRCDIKPLIRSSQVSLVKCDDKIVSKINTCSSGSGLLHILVDTVVNSYRQNRAEKAAQDMHDVVKNYRANEVLMRELTPLLRKTPWLNVQKIEMIESSERQKSLSSRDKLECFLANTTNADIQGIIDFSYSMSPECDTLIASASVIFYPVSDVLKKYLKISKASENPVLKFKAKAAHALSTPKDDLFENANQWNENEAKRLRAGLAQVTHEVMQQIQMMMLHPEALDDEKL